MGNYSPKYVIVGENDEIISTNKDLAAARELVKGTNNRIYNLDTKSYESLKDEMDKFSLKKEVIDFADSIDKMARCTVFMMRREYSVQEFIPLCRNSTRS